MDIKVVTLNDGTDNHSYNCSKLIKHENSYNSFFEDGTTNHSYKLKNNIVTTSNSMLEFIYVKSYYE